MSEEFTVLPWFITTQRSRISFAEPPQAVYLVLPPHEHEKLLIKDHSQVTQDIPKKKAGEQRKSEFDGDTVSSRISPFSCSIAALPHVGQNKWRGQDLNLRPRGYEPRELPGCSTPRQIVDCDKGSISVAARKGSQ